MLRLVYFGWMILLFAACATTAPAATAPRPVTVLISIDGFRADYLDRGVTPVLSGMAADGARGSMRPAFPVKTFPNHYSLVTGLYPDQHGVVDNTMEEPAMPGVTFRMSNTAAVRDGRWWDGAEPIWVTAERAGIKTGTMFWPGSEAEIRSGRPSYVMPFNQAMPSTARADQVLAWLDQPPDRRPGFVTLYFDVVDTAGHNFGPDAPETNAALVEVDAALGQVMAGLKARGQAANVIVVADHGMTAVSPDRRVYLDDLIDRSAIRVLSGGAFVTVAPVEGREAEVSRALVGRHSHATCWERGDMPARFRYGRNPRVAPIICLPDAGWTLSTRDFRPTRPEKGAHGFDPSEPDMTAIFVAKGPAFRQGVNLGRFEIVDVYPLLARLVGAPARPNEGRLRRLGQALAP
jgi:predicted AlkP superfamily pyrophosphatase or phosphodiesterase